MSFQISQKELLNGYQAYYANQTIARWFMVNMDKRRNRKVIRFTAKDLDVGVNTLIKSVSDLSLLSSIIDPYFNGFHVTHDSIALSSFINEMIFHIYGQLSRIYFDESRNYPTISIKVLYNKISKKRKEKVIGYSHKDRFKQSGEKLIEIEKKYKKTLQEFCDKHYAHKELIRGLRRVTQDRRIIKNSWQEIVDLISDAREIIFEINLYLNNSTFIFAVEEYELYQKKFWGLIDSKVFKSVT